MIETAVRDVRINGYAILPNLLPDEQVERLRAALAAMYAREVASDRQKDEPGTLRGYNLLRRDAAFREMVQNPTVIAIMEALLGSDCTLSSLNARAALPGQGFQGLHRDGPWAANMALTCNSLWLLDDFTPENGATRVVPGSNNRPDDPPIESPDEVRILAPAGTVVIFDATTWHGGAQNRTDNPRRVLHGYFCRSWIKPQLDHTRSYDEEWLKDASPLLRRLMGFNSLVAFEPVYGDFRTVLGPSMMDAG